MMRLTDSLACRFPHRDREYGGAWRLLCGEDKHPIQLVRPGREEYEAGKSTRRCCSCSSRRRTCRVSHGGRGALAYLEEENAIRPQGAKQSWTEDKGVLSVIATVHTGIS
ncbi:MAG: hypothetical protein SGPRY_011897 [Prymnesium sp.]